MSFLDSLREDYESEKNAANGGNSGGGQSKYVRMPQGKGVVVIRLLGPAPDGMFGNEKNKFVEKSRVHKINNQFLHDPREEDPLNPRRLTGENPIARYLSWLWKESESKGETEKNEMQAKYRQIKPRKYFYFNCIVREIIGEDGQVERNVGPKVLRCGEQLYKAIMTPIFGDKELQIPALGDVTDAMQGRDFRITQDMKTSGKKEFPSYERSAYLDPSPLGTPEEIKTWYANLHNLKDERQPAPVEVLEQQLQIFLNPQLSEQAFDPAKYGVDAATAALPQANVAQQTNTTPSYTVSNSQQVQSVGPVTQTPNHPVAPVTPPVSVPVSAPVVPPTPTASNPPVAPPVVDTSLNADEFFGSMGL